MILKMTPVHLADVKELAGDLESKPELKNYLKEFSKLDLRQFQNGQVPSRLEEVAEAYLQGILNYFSH